MQTLTNWTITQQLAYDHFRLKNSKPLNQHTFITLTLPYQQIHCDKTIKRECLNHFLINAKRKFFVKNVIWRAETQDNGNIHFHLFTDKYIPHDQLRYQWQQSLEQLGYISWFATENNHLNPNCTDIHSIKKVRNVQAYIAKYISKEITGREICGHAWGRSDNLSKLIPIRLHVDYELHKWLEQKRDKEKNAIYSNEHVGITKFEAIPALETLPYHHRKIVVTTLLANLRCLQ